MARLVIGEVLKPQGIRGEIKIKTYTDDNAAVKNFRRVFIGGEEYKVLSFRTGESGFAFLGLRGVPDRNAAELLRGKEVEAYRRNLACFRRLHRIRRQGRTALSRRARRGEKRGRTGEKNCA